MNRFPVSLKSCLHFSIAAALIFSTAIAAQSQIVPRSLQIPWSATPLKVQLDGVLNEAAWQNAATATDFVIPQTSAIATPQTTARVMADSHYLYVGITAQEPNISKLLHTITARQGSVWSDDCVEFFLDPTHSGAWMYHWVINPNGALWEGLHPASGGVPIFTSNALSAAHIGSDQWTCELKIPWKDLMITPKPGQWLGVNFARERKAGGTNELSSWSPAAGSFTDPEILAPALLGSLKGVQVLSLGSGTADFNQSSMNQFTAQIPWASLPAKVEIWANGKSIASAQLLTSGQLALDYKTPPSALLKFQISQGAKVLFSTTLNAPVPTPRVWQVPDPLYQPLLGNGSPGLAREGVLMWGHNMSNPNILRQAARRYGLRYDLSEMYRQAGQDQMRLFGAPPSPNSSASDDGEKDGVKYVYMVGRGTPWVVDPKALDDAMDQLDQQLTRAGKYIWAISASDEVIHRARLEGANLMAKPPANYPFLQQADNEVRTQFGGGKWGIPQGENDPNPYRWIAYNKWLVVKFHERALRIRAIIKKHHLDLPLISFDPQASAAGNDYSGIAGDYDIFTHQTYQSPNAWRANAGFFTKFLVDLTGKDVWPCVHAENYAFATTPTEAREELSEVFRNGGSGFHFYLPDTAGGNKLVGDMRLCYFGSPRRYNTILNVINLTRTMPQLRYPQNSRTAIVYNDDMLQSTFSANRTPWYSTEACYTFLGPVARSWFKFIDDSKILSSPSLNQQFDTIYVTSATYQRPEIVARLRAFVQNGGTLVCGDAAAFSTDTLGNDTSLQRRQIFGVETDKKITPKTLSVRLNQKSYTLPVLSPAVLLKPVAGTRVLGTFDDGSPAITAHALGHGQAILFAANPFVFEALPDSQWRGFFTAWAAHLNDPVGLDIWRFQFPDSVLGKDIPTPPGVCLTNNHVTWQEEKPVTLRNVNLDGKYQLQPAPDAMPDADVAPGNAQSWISFADGHLTDRRQSMLDPKVKPEWYVGFKTPDSRWMDSWKNPASVTLTFDLQKPVMPGTLKFWFDDTLPAFTVQSSNDLQHWQPIGENKTVINAGADVLDTSIPLRSNGGCRYVRVIFAPRENGQKLSLVESELWGVAN